MRVRHSTGSLVDNICFFVALIVVPCAFHPAVPAQAFPQSARSRRSHTRTASLQHHLKQEICRGGAQPPRFRCFPFKET